MNQAAMLVWIDRYRQGDQADLESAQRIIRETVNRPKLDRSDHTTIAFEQLRAARALGRLDLLDDFARLLEQP
jgi:hypothetical protein